VAGQPIQGCAGCFKCFNKKDGQCAVETDIRNACRDKIKGVGGILTGSPTYCPDISAAIKALIERAGIVGRANRDMFEGKDGIVAVRRAGSIPAFNLLNLFFLCGQMIVPGSTY